MSRRIRQRLCKATGKVAYRDEDSALWHARRLTMQRERRGELAAQLWAYQCPSCPWWHLTHLEQRPRQQ